MGEPFEISTESDRGRESDEHSVDRANDALRALARALARLVARANWAEGLRSDAASPFQDTPAPTAKILRLRGRNAAR
ncbi:hypothetical protein [Neoroseomonas lacus]|uniref:Uncharacterized protein n=1 Tax=Neoroseomonas lacus TaxID=287609 RepID=A0A917L1X5_9PROT|nr:hypothetical protein [Neoroseomonas lacus]GGJ40862.1 hypothetical protein GCM10011320_55640 [Neoroseomonas lacus]